MKRSILRWELVGMGVIIVLGSLLHFAFDWAGRWPPVGSIAAVNESVWEHLKLGFWPALAYAIVEYKYLKKVANNFPFAKTAGIYLIPITIVVLYYSYTAILGHGPLVVDILIFVVAVIVGQLVSYKLLVATPLPGKLNRLSLIALVLLGLSFILFTFYPPLLPIFRDSVTGAYGILR